MERPTKPLSDLPARWTALFSLALGIALAFLLRQPVGDEEVAHYLIARFAPERPDLFLSLVGRPLVTVALCLPAQLGLTAARILAALVTAGTVYALARILQRSGFRLSALWAAPLLLLQPFFLAHAATAMTEPLAAGLLAFGLLAWLERRRGWLVLLAVLVGLARTELVILWPLVVWQLLAWGSGRLALWLLVPFPLWGLLGALVSGDPLWLPHQAQWGFYQERDASHYLRSFGWVDGPGLVFPILLGFLTLRRPTRDEPDDGARLCLVAAVIVVALLVVYTALAWWLPVTYGNLRYLAAIAAPLAILAASGFARLAHLRERGVLLRAGLALLLVGLVAGHELHNDFVILERWSVWPTLTAAALLLVAWIRPGRPAWPATVAGLSGAAALFALYPTSLYWTANPEMTAVAEAAAARPAALAGAPDRLRSAHPALAFRLGRNPYNATNWPPLPENFRSSAPVGTLLFWDSHYLAPRGGSWAPESFVTDPNWEFLSGVIARDSTFAGAWFERRSAPRAAAEAPANATSWLGAVRGVIIGAARNRRLAEADPGNAGAWRSLALQLVVADRIPEARAAFARLESIAPGAPENALVASSLSLKIGEPETALAALNRAIAVQPQNGELRLITGRLLAQLGRAAEARPHLEDAARRLRKRWDVQQIVGTFLMEQQDWPAAEVHFRAAARMNPRNPDPALRLVEVIVRQRRNDEAQLLLQDLIRRQPTLPTAYLYLGDLLKARGRREEARRAWQDGLSRTGAAVLKERLAAP